MDVLIDYAHQYKTLYEQPVYNVFHIACGCVIAQKIKFEQGRNIRKALYQLCGFPLTQENIKIHDLTQIKGLSPDKIILLKKMAEMEENVDHYCKLYGFGTWSYNAVGILINKRDDINLSCDKYIQKNIKLYNGMTSAKEYFQFIETAQNNKTITCYFLWRIKPTSIVKLKHKLPLTREDFI